jgi:hypothetical protein
MRAIRPSQLSIFVPNQYLAVNMQKPLEHATGFCMFKPSSGHDTPRRDSPFSF